MDTATAMATDTATDTATMVQRANVCGSAMARNAAAMKSALALAMKPMDCECTRSLFPSSPPPFNGACFDY